MMKSMATKNASLSQLEDTLELYLVKKAPFQLPKNVKEIIVKIAPWFTLVGLIISLPLVLVAIGLGTLVAPFTAFLGPAAVVSYGVNYTFSMIVLGIALVLEAMAIPGLFARSKKGWRLVYYSMLVSLVSNLITFNIVGGLIGAVIGLYFLFQVKELYK